MKKTIFFDMNETLLNLSLLEKQLEKHFEDAFVLTYWFITHQGIKTFISYQKQNAVA